MKFDVFFSICQTPVDGFQPSEHRMFLNFFDQVRVADELGYGTAWVAETHLSCQVQKRNPGAVIPHFQGEIGLNTDILQLAQRIFAQTKRINVGSAIRNIQCNGGPIAHAEAIRMFLALHALDSNEKRLLEIGFAAGRFPFSNVPYGIRPRCDWEEAGWSVLKNKIFHEATEIFLRFLKGEIFASKDVSSKTLQRSDFVHAKNGNQDWQKICKLRGVDEDSVIEVEPFWHFDQVGVIPAEVSLANLRLTIGSHDPYSHDLANRFLPCGVFNLSITPSSTIEETHQRMQKVYHAAGGAWSRHSMPRTVLVFLENGAGLSDTAKNERAQSAARSALSNYWRAIEGTLAEDRVSNAVDNALVGHPAAIIAQMRARFKPEDRLMLWFDFNNHDNEAIKESMRQFAQHVAQNL